jgi:exosortase A-associated hydrolase 2
LTAVSRAQIEAFFLARDEHSLFCVLFSPPPGQPRVGSVVHVPAFAEEMNKSRRAVASAARAMAERGWQVLVFDLHGTGDSSDDFGDATWSGWLEDVHAAVRWLRERTGTEPVLWGLRTGCLLINDVLEQADSSRLIYWQPTLTGDAALTQFLRLRTVGAVSNAERPKETTKALLETLQGGTSLEIAGYSLAPMVAMPLRQARLGGTRCAGKRITWLEVSTSDPPECSPASNMRIEELRAAGAHVVTEAVAGTYFWSTQEIDEGAPLVSATVDLTLESP